MAFSTLILLWMWVVFELSCYSTAGPDVQEYNYFRQPLKQVSSCNPYGRSELKLECGVRGPTVPDFDILWFRETPSGSVQPLVDGGRNTITTRKYSEVNNVIARYSTLYISPLHNQEDVGQYWCQIRVNRTTGSILLQHSCNTLTLNNQASYNGLKDCIWHQVFSTSSDNYCGANQLPVPPPPTPPTPDTMDTTTVDSMETTNTQTRGFTELETTTHVFTMTIPIPGTMDTTNGVPTETTLFTQPTTTSDVSNLPTIVFPITSSSQPVTLSTDTATPTKTTSSTSTEPTTTGAVPMLTTLHPTTPPSPDTTNTTLPTTNGDATYVPTVTTPPPIGQSHVILYSALPLIAVVIIIVVVVGGVVYGKHRLRATAIDRIRNGSPDAENELLLNEVGNTADDITGLVYGDTKTRPPNGGIAETRPPDGGIAETRPPDKGTTETRPPDRGITGTRPPDRGITKTRPPDGGIQIASADTGLPDNYENVNHPPQAENSAIEVRENTTGRSIEQTQDTDTPLTVRNVTAALKNLIDWYSLGINLGIENSRLAEIRFDFNRDGLRMQKYEMISWWLQSDTDPSWDKLCRALEDMDMGAMAAEIKSKYCVNTLGIM